MLSFLGIGHSADIGIHLDDEETRRKDEIKAEDGQVYQYPVYYDGESISGSVTISIKRGNKLEHQGIKIEFIGAIEFYTDRGNRDEFICLTCDLARQGILSQPTTYPFEFSKVEKPYESYSGNNVRLRYFLKVTVLKRLSDSSREREIIVQSLTTYPEFDNSIQMEVGIEDSLHIEFEYNKSKYHLQDVIVGKIYFLLVRIKIKNMEIQILKRETIGFGNNAFSDVETLAKYEIMDGAPVRGESIPIRLFLHGYGLTPTMRDVGKKFSVRYFLNLVLLDEEDRRYYKQQEITLYRKPDRRRKAVTQSTLGPHSPIRQHSLSSRAQGEQDVLSADPAEAGDQVQDAPSLHHPSKEFNSQTDSFPDSLVSERTSTANEKDDDSCVSSGSPDDARAARSMHRYESKQERRVPTLPEASPTMTTSQDTMIDIESKAEEMPENNQELVRANADSPVQLTDIDAK